MPKPRIALISHDFFPIKGGQGRNFSELFKRLTETPSEFEFVAFSPCRNDLPNHYETLSFTNKLPWSQLQFSFFLNFTLPHLCRKRGVSLALCNAGPGGILFFLAPPVSTIICANHTYSQQARLPGQHWKRCFIPFERLTYSFASALVAISATTRDELISGYGLPKERMGIIPVGVDAAVFRPLPAEEKIPDSILFVGRLDQRKGVDLLVQALPAVLKQVPNATLYLIGKGPLRQRLYAEAAELGLAERVVFLGAIPDAELPGWYNRCTVMAVPSLLEGLGITVLEGLACGIPIVGTAVPGLSAVLRNNENGLLVESGAKADLAEKLALVLQNAALRKQLSLAGPQLVQRDFSWDIIVARYLLLFAALIKRRAS